MLKIIKYLWGLCVTIILTLNLSQIKAFAAGEPTMNSNWGFPNGKSLQVPTRYWQYGGMNWSSSVSYARDQFSASPANISVTLSSSHSYDNCRIRASSNYWTQFDWWGLASNLTSSVKTIELNSSQIQKDVSSGSLEWYKKKVAAHELGHVFGLNHATSKNYPMCQGFVNYNYITNYENQLLVNRYGRY